MTTTITFIGLLILTNLTSTGGEIIVGMVPGMMPMHDAIIAYDPEHFVSQENWPRAGRLVIGDDVYDYVDISQENITFNGPMNQFVNLVDKMPHLSCCCPSMTALRPEYANMNLPATTKGAAHITFGHGLYQSFPANTGAIMSQLVFTDSPQLIIVGEMAGSPTRRLVLDPGADIIVANASLAALSGYVSPSPTSHDFLAYYNMGVGAATCTSAPGDTTSNNPCAPSLLPCQSLSSAKPGAAVKVSAEHRKIAEKAKAEKISMVVDINCSGSQWP